MPDKIVPKEITKDHDIEDYHIASFGYYDGLKYAKEHNLQHTTSFSDVNNFTHYIVCCSDVMIRVKETDYPEIERRII